NLAIPPSLRRHTQSPATRASEVSPKAPSFLLPAKDFRCPFLREATPVARAEGTDNDIRPPRNNIKPYHINPLHLGPSFSRTLGPCSSHSCFVTHMLSLSAMMLASTAPPRNTMCLLRGGSSIRTLNLFSLSGFPPSTRVSHSCFSSFSSREGRPGYMLLPPDSTMALKSEGRTSTAADWIVSKSDSAMPLCSQSTRCGWKRHS